MTFDKALIQLRAGEKVRRACWAPGVFIYRIDPAQRDTIYIAGPNRAPRLWGIEPHVLFADDWEVYR